MEVDEPRDERVAAREPVPDRERSEEDEPRMDIVSVDGETDALCGAAAVLRVADGDGLASSGDTDDDTLKEAVGFAVADTDDDAENVIAAVPSVLSVVDCDPVTLPDAQDVALPDTDCDDDADVQPLDEPVNVTDADGVADTLGE